MNRRAVLAAATVTLLAASVAVPAGADAATPRQRLTTLLHQRRASASSVSVLDVTTGHSLTAGSASGMVTASVVKLELLETLLAVRQAQHRRPTPTERSHLLPMIEHSSNADASWVYRRIGGRAVVARWESRLGLSTKRTVIGHHGYWGLTTTSAAEQVVVLGNLVDATSPLHKAARTYALGLMRHVEHDQRWGVPVVATSGKPANKNGWVDVSRDHGYWAVNSVGVVTVHKHVLLIAVMTQHNHGFAAGKRRVETLARAVVAAERAK